MTLKIKNIKQYRSFYKSTRPVSQDLDENYMGNFYDDTETNQRKYGWFTMYHGDKDGYGTPQDGIANFLQSFLDMAKDGQAVYEFLQNAVDAGSTHYTMVWGKDEVDGNQYVLIANNGKMFDFNSIRSILNVGSSTKTADSKSIGKFGIGFKLAHRLVGKDNGLDELINENPSGPILFSWKNYEIAQLAQKQKIEPYNIEFGVDDKSSYSIDNDHPWLFKILLTCFPCLPENDQVLEDVKLIDGNKAELSLFKKEEYDVLSRWVAKYEDILNEEIYKEGSLFFIKLGSGKDSQLADKNLAEGVKFSLAILQETAENKDKNALQTVQLNREAPITRPELNYLFFHITKKQNLAEYIYIRFGEEDFNKLSQEQKIKVEKEDDIEVIFGFRDHNKIADYFKGAPNFYLYFPLSEEVHNFNFILHSNAFYKASPRTFLHKGSTGEDGINERLLRTVAEKLREELIGLYNSTKEKDKQKFLHLYAALLTSRESSNQDRQWVKEPFIDELTKTLNTCIPIRSSFRDTGYTIAGTSSNVYIKSTTIDIDLANWGLSNIKWFYWSTDADMHLRLSAQNKLNVKSFDIYELLQSKEVYKHVNEWIEEERSRARTILNELNILVDRNKVTETFKQNLSKLKLFEFTNGELLSIDEITSVQKDGYIILHNNLASVNDELLKCNLITSLLNLDNFQFYENFNSYFSMDSQLRKQEILIEIFSKQVNKEVSKSLSKEEKLKVFRVFREMIEEGKRISRLKELKLFNNETGEPVHLKNLLFKTNESWLKEYTISDKEYSNELDRYLLSNESDIYEGIVYPFWPNIGNNITSVNKRSANAILLKIKEYYELCDASSDNEMLLSEHEYLFHSGDFIKAEKPYLIEESSKIDDEAYTSIQNITSSHLGLQIPDYFYINFYREAPFFFEDGCDPLDFEDLELSTHEAQSLLLFFKVSKLNLFHNATLFKEENGLFSLINNCKEENYYSPVSKIKNYISNYLNSELVPIPEELLSYESLLEYRSEALANHLIERADPEDEVQLLELTEALLNESNEVLYSLLAIHNEIKLNTDWDAYTNHNEVYLKFLKRLLQSHSDYLEEIQEKLIFRNDENRFHLGSIDQANDTVTINCAEKVISLSRSAILNLEDETGIKQIRSFADEALNRELLSHSEAKTLFKISESIITDELIDRFKESLTDNKIENSHQLALVLLCEKIDRDELKEFKVFSADEKWYSLEGNWVLPTKNEVPWYNKSYKLSHTYLGIESLLQLTGSETLQYGSFDLTTDEEIEEVLIPNFLFQSGCSANVFNQDCDNLELIKHIFNCWKKTPKDKKIDKADENWEDVFGFNPSLKVLAPYLIEDEKLEEDLLEWLCTDTKLKILLLNALGVNTETSKVVKLRKWLIEDSREGKFTEAIDQINVSLLSNTLVGVAEEFKIPVAFKINSQKHKILNEIIEIINNDTAIHEYRVPVFLTTEELILGSEAETLPSFINQEDYDPILNQCDKLVLNSFFEVISIIYRDEKLNSLIETAYQELKLDFDFDSTVTTEEHNEPFYNSWREEHEIRLFKQTEIKHNVVAKLGDEEIGLGCISTEDYFIDDLEVPTNIYYTSKLRWEDLRDQLSSGGFDAAAEAVDELISSRDKTLASFYHAISASGRDGFDEDDATIILESLKKKNIEEERREVVDEIKNERRYSYLWFERYIRYLLSFESIAETTSQKSIAFQKIKPYKIDDVPSNKYFLLEGGSSLIPVNIEAFEDFTISLILKNRKKINIGVEGVSKRGQNLLVYVPQGIDYKTISCFPDVVSVKINFSPILDLVKKLYTAFSNEKIISPWTSIEESLTPVHLIYGPPGTGKTTTLCRSLEEHYLKNPFFKALILVPTNKAGDVIAKRLVQEGSNLSIARIGNATDPELEALDEEIYQSSIDDAQLDNINLVITTIHRLPYYQISKEHGSYYHLFSSEVKWDFIIFDEASMISLPYIVFAMQALAKYNTNAKFIVAGDPKQIPPVVDASDKDLEELELDEENIYKMLGINSFSPEEQQKVLRPVDSIENLTVQYRSVEKIGQLFSEFSYQSLLTHGRDFNSKPVKQLPATFIAPLKSSIAVIDFPIDGENTVLSPKKLLYSSYHIHAGILTVELIKHLDTCNVEGRNYSIGIISPYKAQAMVINKLITSSDISENLTIHCDTVHGFQGDECDIVIFVVNPNQLYYSGHKKALLSKEYIYNVAKSRAKDYLWIMCPITGITNNPHISLISQIAQTNGDFSMVTSREIEKEIFNDPDFIVNHSYLTGHDNINVFGQVDMAYFIKAGSTAIDIQLKK